MLTFESNVFLTLRVAILSVWLSIKFDDSGKAAVEITFGLASTDEHLILLYGLPRVILGTFSLSDVASFEMSPINGRKNLSYG